jgi:hypothetical protein
MLSDEVEWRGLLSDGQFGSRKRRSAIDAAAIIIDRVRREMERDWRVSRKSKACGGKYRVSDSLYKSLMCYDEDKIFLLPDLQHAAEPVTSQLRAKFPQLRTRAGWSIVHQSRQYRVDLSHLAGSSGGEGDTDTVIL